MTPQEALAAALRAVRDPQGVYWGPTVASGVDIDDAKAVDILASLAVAGMSIVPTAELEALDAERLARAYANTEATVRARQGRGWGEPFWFTFAAEYARLADAES